MLTPEQQWKPEDLVIDAEYLEAYAERDAIAGRPNPRFKQSTLYCNTYLNVRVEQVGLEGLTDEEWDLTIF